MFKLAYCCVQFRHECPRAEKCPYVFLLSFLAGSLYIDCGATASYVDPITGVTWVPDSGFISTGENFANVPTAKTLWQDFPELNTLRFFNDTRAKNCYTLPVTINVTYLLTASFLWASYDNTASTPSFGLAIDGTILASVTSDATGATFDQLEFSIQPPNNFTYVCLTQLPLQSGTPFISAIYLRPGPVYALFHQISSRQMIRVRHRLNFGGTSTGRYVHHILQCKGTHVFWKVSIHFTKSIFLSTNTNLCRCPYS